MMRFRSVWILICIWSTLSTCVISLYANIVQGKQFPEDILIGRQTLLDNGGHFDRESKNYYITLMSVEGNTDKYDLSSGYFMGFQWYNDNVAKHKTRINLQLYRKVPTALTPVYTLVNESGWVYSDKGLNVYYFNESIVFDPDDFIGDSYVIGFMVPPNEPDSVLFYDENNRQCNTDSTDQVMYAKMSTQPTVGDTVLFTEKNCYSYYIQGIFAKSHYASSTSGRCSLYVASEGRPLTVVSQKPFPGNGYPSNQPVCQQIRAEYRNLGLKLTTKAFEFPYDTDCLEGGVTIGDQDSITEGYAQIGRYCGYKDYIFETKYSRKPYVKLDLLPENNFARYEGYMFEVEAASPEPVVAAIILGIVGGVILLLLLIMLAVCICCYCKITKTTPGRVISTESRPLTTGQGVMFNNPNQPSIGGQQLGHVNQGMAPAYPVTNNPGHQQPLQVPSTANSGNQPSTIDNPTYHSVINVK